MRIARWLLPLTVVLPLAGCMLTSGQFVISFDLVPNPVDASNPGVTALPVDLTTESDYNDHKQDLKDVADVALLGEVTNTTAGNASVEFWMTRALTAYTAASQVTGDTTAVKVWGTLSLGPSEVQRIDWDASAGLFSGRQALLEEVKGDGQFTLYAIGTAGATARIRDGVLVIVLDGGI